MQKQYRNKNLLRPNARNQWQQIKPRRYVKDRRVRDEIENNQRDQKSPAQLNFELEKKFATEFSLAPLVARRCV
jgi:hypothetical protein